MSSHVRRVGPPLVLSATQKNTCSATGDCHCMYHPWPLFSCSSTEIKLSSTVKASAKLAVSVVRLSLKVHEKKGAEM